VNNYWKVILATMVIFGAGVVTGGLLVRQSQRVRVQPPHYAAPQQLPQAQRPTQASPTATRLDFLRRIQPQLNLSPDQRQRVERVFAESQERTRTLMEPVTPLVREEVQRAKREFREVLTPRQQRIFDELTKPQPRARDPRRQPGPNAAPGTGEVPDRLPVQPRENNPPPPGS
jgi:Spy/CpxP family protein refolding chaperone